MELELHPSVTMHTGTFNALVAPPELVLPALNGNPEVRRFLFLYVCGNYSGLLSGINRRLMQIEVRRAFTAHQLVTILREAHHTIVFVEHDASLYEDAEELTEPVAGALSEAAESALVILYAPKGGGSFDAIARKADRVFFVNPLPPAGPGRVRRPVPRPRRIARNQTTLEGF